MATIDIIVDDGNGEVACGGKPDDETIKAIKGALAQAKWQRGEPPPGLAQVMNPLLKIAQARFFVSQSNGWSFLVAECRKSDGETAYYGSCAPNTHDDDGSFITMPTTLAKEQFNAAESSARSAMN